MFKIYILRHSFFCAGTFLAKEVAEQFLDAKRSRVARSYVEECLVEGCDVEEVDELKEDMRENHYGIHGTGPITK